MCLDHKVSLPIKLAKVVQHQLPLIWIQRRGPLIIQSIWMRKGGMQAIPLCWMKKGPLKTLLAYEYQAKMHVCTLVNQLSIYFFFIFLFIYFFFLYVMNSAIRKKGIFIFSI